MFNDLFPTYENYLLERNLVSLAAKGGLFKRKPREFWFDGEAATKLRDYFENPDHVTQLLPSSSPRSQAGERIRQWQHIRHRRSLVQPLDFQPEAETTNWDDESPELPKLIEDGWEYDEGLDFFDELPRPNNRDDESPELPKLIEDGWEDDGWSDPPDEPPPRPNIGRRPWKPQPPDPLSTAVSVESFNPPIP